MTEIDCDGCEGRGCFHTAGTTHSQSCGKCLGTGKTRACEHCGKPTTRSKDFCNVECIKATFGIIKSKENCFG